MRKLGFTQDGVSLVFAGSDIPTPEASNTRSKVTRTYRTSTGFRKQQLGRNPRRRTYRGQMVAYGNVTVESGAYVLEDRTADFDKLVGMSEKSDPLTTVIDDVVEDTWDVDEITWDEGDIVVGAPLRISFTVQLEEAVDADN